MVIKELNKLIRFTDWKNYIVPFLLGFIFISVYIFEIHFTLTVSMTVLLLVSIVGTAAYGYLLNNLFDLAEDKCAGKSNFTEYLSHFSKASLLLIFLTISLFPWLFLPVGIINFGLFILQLLLLAAYSIPPLRLKRFIYAGVITDALYNSVIMVFVIIITIVRFAETVPENGCYILTILLLLLFIKGVRGIILHQLADRKNDLKSEITTFVLKYGALTTSNFIIRGLIPIEVLIQFILLIMISKYLPGIFLMFLAFLFYKALKLRLWNIRAMILRHHGRPLRFMFLYVLNDLYEEWIPLFVLILLTIRNISFIFILVPYILIFPRFFIKIFKDVPEIVINFKSDLSKIRY